MAAAGDEAGPLTEDDLRRLADGDTQGTSIQGFETSGCDAGRRADDLGRLKVPGGCGNVFWVPGLVPQYAFWPRSPTLPPARRSAGCPRSAPDAAMSDFGPGLIVLGSRRKASDAAAGSGDANRTGRVAAARARSVKISGPPRGRRPHAEPEEPRQARGIGRRRVAKRTASGAGEQVVSSRPATPTRLDPVDLAVRADDPPRAIDLGDRDRSGRAMPVIGRRRSGRFGPLGAPGGSGG
jgi:hypothetical protein